MNRISHLSLVILVACGSRPPPLEVSTAPAQAPDAAAPETVATAAVSESPGHPTCNARPEPLKEDERERYRDRFGSRRNDKGESVCAVADDNLARAHAAVAALPAPAAGPARTPWNKKSAPARLDLVERRFALTAEERARLLRDGFVVPARLAQESYAWAYHEIYQSQLPLFVTVDSILNAVYATHDRLVGDLERTELAPLVTAIVKSLHCALPVAAARFPRETALDLDVYLTVARRLLEGGDVASALGDDHVARQATALVAKANAAGAMAEVELFGRVRAIDFTQFTPRGHYTTDLAPYFKGAMWLSRTEWNLVSRSSRSSHPPGGAPDPRETPREVIDALALAELVVVAGQDARLAAFERAYGLLAGRREDVSVVDLLALEKQAGIIDLKDAGAATKLIAAVGTSFQRTARIHPMPQGATTLPAIATLLGPRIVPDTVALRPLAHSEVPDRHRIRGGDLAFVLGLDRGLEHLTADLKRFPSLRGQLEVARKALADAPRTDDLYTSWLDAIRALAAPARGQVPSFMDTPQYADLRVSSAVAGFAQIRHNHVLIAGQAYGEGGCKIPDSFVEPAVEVYEALARYAERGAAALTPFTSYRKGKKEPVHDYFVRLGKTMRILATISRYELANQPLPKAAQEWLSMVTEIEPFGSDGRPTYTGWYFDLFDHRPDGIAHPDLIADFFTSPQEGISYAGVGLPRIGIFIVDTGGAPRAVVGPVTHAYEHVGPLGKRLDDSAARLLPAKARSSPWASSYEIPAPPEPSFGAHMTWDDKSNNVITITARKWYGPMTIELLDHHRVPIQKFTANVGAGTTRVVIKPAPKEDDPPEEYDHEHAPHMVHFQLGNWHGYGELQCMNGCRKWGWGELAPKEPTYE